MLSQKSDAPDLSDALGARKPKSESRDKGCNLAASYVNLLKNYLEQLL